jgi:hypothetical protein
MGMLEESKYTATQDADARAMVGRLLSEAVVYRRLEMYAQADAAKHLAHQLARYYNIGINRGRAERCK